MNQVEINKLDGLRLSPHFTLRELCKTSYHTTDGNIPSHVAIENLRNICENWLELLRDQYNELYGDRREGGLGFAACYRRDARRREGVSREGVSRNDEEIPIIISSGFRSEEVNRKCGGAKGSNHLTGCAVDIKCYGPEQMIRMAGILLDIADGTKRDLTSSRVCSRSAESIQASLCARSTADFDELIIEKRGTTYWVHFAVRPKDNRRKILFDCR